MANNHLKLVEWTTDVAKEELKKRLSFSREARRSVEREWALSESKLFNTASSGGSASGNINISFETIAELSTSDIDSTSAWVSNNRIFKNLRFIHSQMSANPPTVIPRPSSNDQDDRRRADAADRVVRYGLRKYNLQEKADITNMYTLMHGTGVMKTVNDPDAGEVLEFNEETGEILMEGDFDISPCSTWSLFPDADATCPDEIKYIFEEILMPFEEACYRFPSQHEVLKKYRIQKSTENSAQSGNSEMRQVKYDVVKVYQYWEKGLPYNGMVGRFAWCCEEGELLDALKPNPFRFAPPLKKGQTKQRPGVAQIPYHFATDIDVPGRLWGRSVVIGVANLQDTLDKLDTSTLDNIQAHGTPRMVLPESTEMAGEMSDSPADIYKTTGSQPPFFMQPYATSADIPRFRESLVQGIDDGMGVNEMMFGQQKRESSALNMQYATNQGNMVRRRLFNKYVLQVESVYKAYLNLVIKYWEETRTIEVIGKEKAFEVIDLKGADISGGFDLVVEYGASLSLDPISRREEIMTLMPLFEKAGVPTRTILGMMKLNELEGLYDRIQMANDRQREIFEEMIATQAYIEPRKLADHKNMLAYAYDYIMTSEFKYLEETDKVLIEKHIEAREQIAAQGAAASAQEAAPGAPGALPAVPNAAAPATAQQGLALQTA